MRVLQNILKLVRKSVIWVCTVILRNLIRRKKGILKSNKSYKIEKIFKNRVQLFFLKIKLDLINVNLDNSLCNELSDIHQSIHD